MVALGMDARVQLGRHAHGAQSHQALLAAAAHAAAVDVVQVLGQAAIGREVGQGGGALLKQYVHRCYIDRRICPLIRRYYTRRLQTCPERLFCV